MTQKIGSCCLLVHFRAGFPILLWPDLCCVSVEPFFRFRPIGSISASPSLYISFFLSTFYISVSNRPLGVFVQAAAHKDATLQCCELHSWSHYSAFFRHTSRTLLLPVNTHLASNTTCILKFYRELDLSKTLHPFLVRRNKLCFSLSFEVFDQTQPHLFSSQLQHNIV